MKSQEEKDRIKAAKKADRQNAIESINSYLKDEKIVAIIVSQFDWCYRIHGIYFNLEFIHEDGSEVENDFDLDADLHELLYKTVRNTEGDEPIDGEVFLKKVKSIAVKWMIRDENNILREFTPNDEIETDRCSDS